MNTEERVVGSPVTGLTKKAQFAICERCGHDQFFIWVIKGHNHCHFQCARCSSSYCAGPECAAEGPMRN